MGAVKTSLFASAPGRFVAVPGIVAFKAYVLPASITQLTFGGDFNQFLSVGMLPANLTKLSFRGASFEHALSEDVLHVFAFALEAGKT
jgi:hypothetical protein